LYSAKTVIRVEVSEAIKQLSMLHHLFYASAAIDAEGISSLVVRVRLLIWA